MESRAESDSKLIFTWPLLWTLALYLSDILVFLTPLPIIYAFAIRGHLTWKKLILPASLVILSLYIILTPYLLSWYESYQFLRLLFSLPLIEFYKDYAYVVTILLGISYFISLISLGYIIGNTLKSKKNPIFLISGFSLVVSLILIFVIAQSFSVEKVSLISGIENYYREAINEFITQQKQGSLPLEQLVYLEEGRDQILKFCVYLSPTFLYSGIFLVAMLNLILARKLFFKFIFPTKLYPLSKFEIPFFSVWLFIASLGGLLLNIYVLNSNVIEFVCANLLAILIFFYYLQGLNIVSFYLFLKKVGPFLRLSIFLMFILFFQALGVFVISLGFFDAWFDFRKLHQKKKIKK